MTHLNGIKVSAQTTSKRHFLLADADAMLYRDRCAGTKKTRTKMHLSTECIRIRSEDS